MAYEFEHVQVEVADGIATARVSRPEKLNALNGALIDELDRAFRALADDDAVHAIVLTGAGEKAFVAGADIAELATMDPIGGVRTSRQGQDAFRFLERMRKPVIGAINGFALGGGLELALACHLRLASDNAKFGLPEVRLGIIPGYGGTVRLPRLVGKGRALELILSGEMIDAEKALRIGLVSRVLAAPELMPAVEAVARTILSRGPLAVRMAKEAVRRGLETPLDEGLRIEADLFAIVSSAEDMKEGMRAFLEKRPPLFKGK
jgi:enoyl-CoA hydratase